MEFISYDKNLLGRNAVMRARRSGRLRAFSIFICLLLLGCFDPHLSKAHVRCHADRGGFTDLDIQVSIAVPSQMTSAVREANACVMDSISFPHVREYLLEKGIILGNASNKRHSEHEKIGTLQVDAAWYVPVTHVCEEYDPLCLGRYLGAQTGRTHNRIQVITTVSLDSIARHSLESHGFWPRYTIQFVRNFTFPYLFSSIPDPELLAAEIEIHGYLVENAVYRVLGDQHALIPESMLRGVTGARAFECCID
jgi:hypothetical protein